MHRVSVSPTARSWRRPMLAAAVRRCSRQSAMSYGCLPSLLEPQLAHMAPWTGLFRWAVFKPRIATKDTSSSSDEKLIKDYIRELDTENLINLDSDGSANIYNSAIKTHRVITKLTPEEHRRAMLVAMLVYECDYAPSVIELEVPAENKQRVDVLVKRSSGIGYMHAECKSQIGSWDRTNRIMTILKDQIYPVVPPLGSDAEPCEQQRFGLIFSTRRASDNENICPDSVLVDLQEYPTLTAYKQGGESTFTNSIPKDYVDPRNGKRPYGNVEETTEHLVPLTRDKSSADLEKHRREMHNMMWGNGGASGSDAYRVMMQLMLCRIHDERQTPRNRAYEFQTRKGEEAEALRDRMELLFEKAAKELMIAPQVHFRAISATALKACIEELQSISLTRSAHSSQPNVLVQTDVLGDFFEKTLSSTFKQSQGQFFTHKVIADFVTRLAGVADLVSAKTLPRDIYIPTVIDPTSGSGTFLIEALAQMEEGRRALNADRDALLTDPVRHLLAQSLKQTQPDQKPARGWADGRLYGMDSNEDMSFVCKLNLLMHGADPGRIFQGSSLRAFDHNQIEEGSFDIVLTNPPFSVKLSHEEVDSLEKRGFTLAKPQTAKRSEHVFLEVWHRLLRPGGCFSAVVPEAMLDVPLYKNARIKLLELFWVDAVIALPKSTFMPYTGTKTVVLRATKKSDSETSEWKQAIEDAERRFKTDEERFKYAFELTAKDRRVFLAEPEQTGYARSLKGEKRTGSDLVVGEGSDLEVGDRRVPRSVLGCWQERAYDQRDRRYGFWIKLSDVVERESLRLDPKHHWLWTVNAGRINPTYEGEVQPLRALVTRMKPTYATASKATTDSRDSPIGVSGDDAIMGVDSDTDEDRVQVDVQTGEGFPFVTETHVAKLDAKRLEFGASDIALFSIRPFKVLRNQVAKRWIGSVNWELFQTTDAVENVSFVHALFMSDEFRDAVACTASGMVMARMVTDDVLDLKVPVYTPEKQREVGVKFDKAYEKCERILEKTSQLTHKLRAAYRSARPKP